MLLILSALICISNGRAVPARPTSNDRDYQDLRLLHERHASWFKRLLVRRYGQNDAEEFEQETWLRLAIYRAISDIRHPRGFLLRVASNLAKDTAARRANASRYEVQTRSLPGIGTSAASQIDAVIMKELILGLPEPLRDVFLLSRLEGLTNVQIGERLGISPKTVEWRMTRALAHCAAQLRR